MAALIQRYLTDDVLQDPGEAVMRATQSPEEDENAFAERIEEANRNCTDVYTERDLVSAFVRGLPDTTGHLLGMPLNALIGRRIR